MVLIPSAKRLVTICAKDLPPLHQLQYSEPHGSLAGWCWLHPPVFKHIHRFKYGIYINIHYTIMPDEASKSLIYQGHSGHRPNQHQHFGSQIPSWEICFGKMEHLTLSFSPQQFIWQAWPSSWKKCDQKPSDATWMSELPSTVSLKSSMRWKLLLGWWW